MDASTERLMEQQIVATLASAIVTSMGRPVSMADVEAVIRDLTSTLFPVPRSGSYEMWKDAFDPNRPYN